MTAAVLNLPDCSLSPATATRPFKIDLLLAIGKNWPIKHSSGGEAPKAHPAQHEQGASRSVVSGTAGFAGGGR